MQVYVTYSRSNILSIRIITLWVQTSLWKDGLARMWHSMYKSSPSLISSPLMLLPSAMLTSGGSVERGRKETSLVSGALVCDCIIERAITRRYRDRFKRVSITYSIKKTNYIEHPVGSSPPQRHRESSGCRRGKTNDCHRPIWSVWK